MNEVIREANEHDADRLTAYLIDLAAQPDSMLHLQTGALANAQDQAAAWIQGDGLLLVVETQGEIVGLLRGQGSDEVWTRHAVTFSLSLRKDVRDTGIGAECIRRGLEWARSRSYVRRVQLEVLTDQEETIRLYERLGFETEGWRLRAYYVNQRYVDTYLMAQQIA
ncbi:MAG: GNAT family N-acetyltransferase [Anaerolineae bacterium]|nr:GNAT family N-acetyltransferase [Anaerolineae bacterium]